MRTRLRMGTRLVVAVVTVGIMSMACQKATIPIGAVISLTGPTGPSVDGEGVRDGLQLAIEEANARGGLNGRKLELILADAKSSEDEAKAAFERIEKARRPLFYVSTLSNPSLALSPLAGQAQVPLFCLVSASSKITQGSDWVYRYWSSATTYAPVYLSLLGKLGVRRLGVVYLNDEFGASVFELVGPEFTKSGGSIRGERFGATETDHSQRISRLMDSDAILIVCQTPQVVPVIDQIRKSGYTGKVLATNSVANPTVTKLPEAQGVYSAVPMIFKASFLYARELMQKFAARYGRELNLAAAAGYDLIKLVGNLLEDQEISRPNLKARLRLGFVHSGVFGELRLSPGQRDLEMPAYAVQIVDGTIQYQ